MGLQIFNAKNNVEKAFQTSRSLSAE